MTYYSIIKNIFLFALSFHIYIKLSNSNSNHATYIKTTIASIALSLFSFIISQNFSTIYFPLAVLLYIVIIFLMTYKNCCFSITYAIVSFSVVFVVFSILTIPTTLLIYYIVPPPATSYISFITFSIGILSTFVICLLLRNKRFTKALYVLCGYSNFYMYAFLCFCIILIIVNAQSKIQDTGNNKIFSIALIATTLLLLHIIRREVQKYYLSRLKKLELESLRQELAEKDAMIQKLKDSNDHLAHLVHQDNKLIPAMESAVQHYLTDAASTPETQLVKGQALAQELQRLAEDRQGNLTSYQSLRDLPHTGHAGVDAMLSHMQERALAQNIEYKLQIAADFSTAIDNQISEADLVHLLSDLIENAIIATKTCEHREIFISLGMPNGVPNIEVRDSGTPFSPSVYQDFGIEKHSTHLDDGGSGIGLMDIWTLKRKYAASLHIHEYAPETAPFTKRITLLFDRKNHYLIRTFRPQEILKCRARTDMYVLPLE